MEWFCVKKGLFGITILISTICLQQYYYTTKWDEMFWLVESYASFHDVHKFWLASKMFHKINPKNQSSEYQTTFKSYNKAHVDLFWVNIKMIYTSWKIIMVSKQVNITSYSLKISQHLLSNHNVNGSFLDTESESNPWYFGKEWYLEVYFSVLNSFFMTVLSFFKVSISEFAHKSALRLFSLSATLINHRKGYYTEHYHALYPSCVCFHWA